MKLPAKLAFVDVETTGGSLRSDSIIEIGIVRVEDGQVTQTFKTVIDPQQFIPEQIFQLTGINPSEIEGAPTFRQIHDQVLELLSDCVLVAHNARFDYGFLKQEFSRLGISFSSKHCCTVKLSRSLFPQHKHHNLDVVIERFGFQCEHRHRAYDDAFVLWQFYQAIQMMFPVDVVEEAVTRALQRPSIPIKLPVEILDALPEKPGVYIFYGSNRAPLYVGKSINLRQRVLSHFSQDYASSTEMKISQQIESIETIETAGELGALFKESQLVKEMQPLYNRKLRHSHSLVCLRAGQDKEGYFTVTIEPVKSLDPEHLDEILATAKSIKQAKELLLALADEHTLCQKLLGIDHRPGSCFGHQLGKCQGGCQGKELPALYNLRFAEAFKDSRLQSWPYAQPILIEEKSPWEDRSEGFIFDKWCLVGSVSVRDGGHQIHTLPQTAFDLDMYKILRSYLRSPKAKHIKPLHPQELQSLFQD